MWNISRVHAWYIKKCLRYWNSNLSQNRIMSMVSRKKTEDHLISHFRFLLLSVCSSDWCNDANSIIIYRSLKTSTTQQSHQIHQEYYFITVWLTHKWWLQISYHYPEQEDIKQELVSLPSPVVFTQTTEDQTYWDICPPNHQFNLPTVVSSPKK